jgi:hypothetical protein
LRRVESLPAAKRLQNAKVSVVDGALIGSASQRKEEPGWACRREEGEGGDLASPV